MLHCRGRPAHKLDIKFSEVVTPAVRKRVYASVYSHVRKSWADVDALRDIVTDYITRAASKGSVIPVAVEWGPHTLYTGEGCHQAPAWAQTRTLQPVQVVVMPLLCSPRQEEDQGRQEEEEARWQGGVRSR